MDPDEPKTQTGYASIDWTEYQKGRPTYPPSLTKLVLDYHRRHPEAGSNRLVDVGAGSGIASLNFIHDFKIVHISDPSKSNEDQARSFLSQYISSHNLCTTLEISQSTGEEAYLKVGECSADMVICATAAHFMDPDSLADSVAKMLRPGGTLAVWTYWFPTFPDQKSSRLVDAFAKALDQLALKPVFESGNTAGLAILAKTLERENAGNGLLDSLPLPNDLFTDPVRIFINPTTDLAPYRALSKQFTTENVELRGVSRVQPEDRILKYESGVDAEAEGWSFDADKEWLSHFLDTIRPLKCTLSEARIREIYDAWELVFDEECIDGRVRLLWPVFVVLATRKES